ncbi:MAG: ornithine carbamoyltransferase, partial [Anaerolineae bacterium]|nr:ornithine carbamoyltransferase [Anaerolineae bacterium]
TTQDTDEGKKIQDKYKDWIADDAKMGLAKDDAIYMHPLPADRQVEVSNSVIDGPNSVVFDEAENRMHAQKAVMALTMR